MYKPVFLFNLNLYFICILPIFLLNLYLHFICILPYFNSLCICISSVFFLISTHFVFVFHLYFSYDWNCAIWSAPSGRLLLMAGWVLYQNIYLNFLRISLWSLSYLCCASTLLYGWLYYISFVFVLYNIVFWNRNIFLNCRDIPPSLLSRRCRAISKRPTLAKLSRSPSEGRHPYNVFFWTLSELAWLLCWIYSGAS